MPVGRLYQPPPPKKLIRELNSPFLEKDLNRTNVKRNFVIPTKKKEALDAPELGKIDAHERAEVDVAASETIEEVSQIVDIVPKVLDISESSVQPIVVVALQEQSDQDVTITNGDWDAQVTPQQSNDDSSAINNDSAVTCNGGRNDLSMIYDDPNGKIDVTNDEATTDDNELSDVEVTSPEENGGKVLLNGNSSDHQNGTQHELNGHSSKENMDLSDPEALDNEEDEPLKRSSQRIAPPTLHLPEKAKGLKNLGNTCFMNSIIQCLAHTQPLVDFCQNFAPEDPGCSEMKITKSFVKLVTEMWKSDSSGSRSDHYFSDRVGDPSGFKREMGSFAPKFLGFEQHDSQEFLQYALEGIHCELNRVKKNENDKKSDLNNNEETNKPEEENNLTPSEAGRVCWRNYLKRDNSLVTDLFLGQFRSTLKCCVCDHESVTFEPFWVVSVPIPAPSNRSRDAKISLQDCIDLFVKEETLDGDEKPTCEECKARTKCVKSYSFERWPRILVIHLKRFSPGERFRSKLSNHIDAPVENLDLSSYSPYQKPMYNLYGVSNHSGTLYGGHYTAHGRHPVMNDNWHLYNDRSVAKSSKHSVISYEAYLLFFEKKSQCLNDNDDHEVFEETEEYDDENGEEEW